MCAIVLGVCIGASIVGLAALVPEPPPCVRTERQLVTEYPYMGLAAFGGTYTTIALIPISTWQDVCVERAKQ